MAEFSMASMTDVIFLLLIFFMVTSTYIFPTALEVNLPQTTHQTTLKPGIRIYLDAEGNMATMTGEGERQPMNLNELSTWLRLAIDQQTDQEPFIALYADEAVSYGKIVEVLNIGAELGKPIVLAAKPIKRE